MRKLSLTNEHINALTGEEHVGLISDQSILGTLKSPQISIGHLSVIIDKEEFNSCKSVVLIEGGR